MSDDGLFGSYVEALTALSTAESRRRDALRKAVESAASAENQARQQMANQQRMYDRASKDGQDAERLLADLRSKLGVNPAAITTSTPQAGTQPQLAPVRSQIRDVAQWAAESKSIVESLLRTRERLAKVPKPTRPTPPPAAQGARNKLPVGVTVAVAALVVILIVVILLITR